MNNLKNCNETIAMLEDFMAKNHESLQEEEVIAIKSAITLLKKNETHKDKLIPVVGKILQNYLTPALVEYLLNLLLNK